MEDVKRILRGIGMWFLGREMETKEYSKALTATYQILQTMNITDCRRVDGNLFEVTLCRPGLLIGSRGSVIEAIQKELGVVIRIKENTLADIVYPIDLEECWENR